MGAQSAALETLPRSNAVACCVVNINAPYACKIFEASPLYKIELWDLKVSHSAQLVDSAYSSCGRRLMRSRFLQQSPLRLQPAKLCTFNFSKGREPVSELTALRMCQRTSDLQLETGHTA